MVYQIVYNGTVICQSSLPYFGYSLPVLKDLEKAGYTLLIDGKRVKFPTTLQYSAAQNPGTEEVAK